MRYRILFIFLLAGLVTMQAALAQHDHYGHGQIDFDISCSEEAQGSFQTGLALLHHMMYEQARAEFQDAATADPNCAMAEWGIAMSLIHPLWGERPSDENLRKGEEAISRAFRMDPPTEREKAFIEAVEAFYADWESTSYAQQLINLEAAFRELHYAYPDDVDAAAFYALGHLAIAPTDDREFTHQRMAGSMLEDLHEKAPQHPGLFHYIIHAYDNPVLADRAIDVARAYDQIAPNVPHALHMPSHIFVRQGIWPDVVSWNERSAEAALNQPPATGVTSMHYAHALDYIMYAHLQRGDEEKSMATRDALHQVSNLQQTFAAAYAVAAMQVRYELERGKWKEAANIPVDSPNGFPLERYPAAQSMVHYARGLGSARSGDMDGARAAIGELDDIYHALLESGESYWAVLTDAHRTTVAAWLAYAEGDVDKAVELMSQAADTEDSVDKHPVTPGHVLPARELLGDMLMELDRPDEALAAYEATLSHSANRYNSLRGAGEAAERIGDAETSEAYFGRLSVN